MKTIATVLLVASQPLASRASSPVSKVVQLLGDMQTKIIAEGEKAQKVYSKMSEWCEERSKNLGYDIKTAKAEIADLTANIEKEKALIASLTSKVDSVASSIANDEADLTSAKAIRAKEAADFKAQERELTDVVNTLQRAIGLLEREMQKGGSSMMQLQNANSFAQAMKVLVQSSSIDSADADRLTALVQNFGETDDTAGGAPAAAVYEGHSAGIIETLEDLLTKAEEQLHEAREKETTSMHNFELLQQSLEDEIKFANKDMAASKTAIAESNEKKSKAAGDLDVTSRELKGDGGSLDDLHHTCMTKAQDFEAETKSRGEELKALADAKQAIAVSTKGADSLSYGLNQASFLQLARSSLSSDSDLAHFEAVHLVRNLARKEKSAELAQLASRMASAMRVGATAGDDPFGKVKGLIADMIERLESEAQADASHKAYCDKELSESSTKKGEKTLEIGKLSTKIDQMLARSSQLKSEISGLQKALSELAKTSLEMKEIRNSEHQAFIKNTADMQSGLEGVKLALKILREYYGQEEKAHSAEEGAGAGVIGLLEVIESDFSKGLAEMTAAEDSAQSSYDTETKEAEIESTTKNQAVAYKTKEATGLDKAVAETSSDRSGVQSEFDAVQSYLDTLKAQCVATAETYSERKARFEAELTGLKEALQILENETVLLQQSTRRALRGVGKHM